MELALCTLYMYAYKPGVVGEILSITGTSGSRLGKGRYTDAGVFTDIAFTKRIHRYPKQDFSTLSIDSLATLSVYHRN